MDDLISRQAAIEALKRAEALTRAFGYHNVIETIRELPSAQPEIIRCKDCKWYEGDIMGNPWGVCCHNGWIVFHCGHEVSENGWCYRAERSAANVSDK